MRRLAAAACALMVGACGAAQGSSPASPSVTSVAVTGAAALTVGDNVQFKAIASTGQDVTFGANWQSSDPVIARVSAQGVVLAVSPGRAIISATSTSVKGQIELSVGAALLTSPTITRCGDIVAPGTYTIASDISQPVFIGLCISIRSGDVELSCADHTVSGIHVFAATNVTVHHCTLQDVSWVTDSANVTFHHNRMATITLEQSRGNTVRDNIIDGGYDGSGRQVGEDDGVILIDERDDTIVDNEIRNVFDAGVEGVDRVTNTVIANNTIDNTGSVGISSYWCTAWTGNTVSGNSITRSPGLVRFIYSVSATKCRDTSIVPVFMSNRFIANRYSQPTPIPQSGGSMNFSLSRLGDAGVENNLIQGNDMGRSYGPEATPENGFINGGGNICAANTSNFCGPLGAMFAIKK
jgi:hypothetical protein